MVQVIVLGSFKLKFVTNRYFISIFIDFRVMSNTLILINILTYKSDDVGIETKKSCLLWRLTTIVT